MATLDRRLELSAIREQPRIEVVIDQVWVPGDGCRSRLEQPA
jgi:hypothetical protein